MQEVNTAAPPHHTRRVSTLVEHPRWNARAGLPRESRDGDSALSREEKKIVAPVRTRAYEQQAARGVTQGGRQGIIYGEMFGGFDHRIGYL
jgi:hypothetical protein